MKELEVELEQLRLLVVAMVGREQVVCASGSGGGTVDKVGEDDERDARESSLQPGRRLRGGKVTGPRETGRKETRRKKMGGKTNGFKEKGEKTLERYVANELRRHIDANGFNDPFQSAYRPRHSTETALVRRHDAGK